VLAVDAPLVHELQVRLEIMEQIIRRHRATGEEILE
jgi:hypothetical protein